MKKTLLIFSSLFFCFPVYGFNIVNNTNQTILVKGDKAYHEVIKAHQISQGWSREPKTKTFVCAYWYEVKGLEQSCCHVSGHGQQIIDGFYKDEDHHALIASCH